MASAPDNTFIYEQCVEGQAVELLFESKRLAESFRTSFARFKTRQDKLLIDNDLLAEEDAFMMSFLKKDKKSEVEIYVIKFLQKKKKASFVILDIKDGKEVAGIEKLAGAALALALPTELPPELQVFTTNSDNHKEKEEEDVRYNRQKISLGVW